MAHKEYEMDNGEFIVTTEIQKEFEQNGFIIVRNMLDEDEICKVRTVVESSDLLKYQYGRPDRKGKEPKLVLWQHPGHDVTGIVARSEKVARTCEQLLRGEVYHYHTKLVSKDPYIGGTFEWHQDYGATLASSIFEVFVTCFKFSNPPTNRPMRHLTIPIDITDLTMNIYGFNAKYWYKYGCIYPQMMTVFIAVDTCKKENGCLQVLKGSHKCGRIDHTIVAEQTGADIKRVEHLMKVCPLVHVELNAGDALFFHCNVLHTSGDNTSKNQRRALVIAYNRASNDPGLHEKHPGYTPLHIVDNSAIKSCENYTDFSGKDFWSKQPQI